MGIGAKGDPPPWPSSDPTVDRTSVDLGSGKRQAVTSSEVVQSVDVVIFRAGLSEYSASDLARLKAWVDDERDRKGQGSDDEDLMHTRNYFASLSDCSRGNDVIDAARWVTMKYLGGLSSLRKDESLKV